MLALFAERRIIGLFCRRCHMVTSAIRITCGQLAIYKTIRFGVRTCMRFCRLSVCNTFVCDQLCLSAPVLSGKLAKGCLKTHTSLYKPPKRHHQIFFEALVICYSLHCFPFFTVLPIGVEVGGKGLLATDALC